MAKSSNFELHLVCTKFEEGGVHYDPMNQSINQRIPQSTNQQIPEWITDWTSKMNLWRNEWWTELKERTKWNHQRINDLLIDRLNEWINERLYERNHLSLVLIGDPRISIRSFVLCWGHPQHRHRIIRMRRTYFATIPFRPNTHLIDWLTVLRSCPHLKQHHHKNKHMISIRITTISVLMSVAGFLTSACAFLYLSLASLVRTTLPFIRTRRLAVRVSYVFLDSYSKEFLLTKMTVIAGAIKAHISPLETSSQHACALPYPTACVVANEMATMMAGKPVLKEAKSSCYSDLESQKRQLKILLFAKNQWIAFSCYWVRNSYQVLTVLSKKLQDISD